MFRLIAAFTIATSALLLFDCRKPVTEQECNELLDRYVELLVRSDRPGTSSSEIVKMQAEARTKAKTDPAFVHCTSEVSRSQFDCAMQAANADVLEQCLL